ncbi:MAG: hypothetical protein GY713_03760, partial [Actinomycetia bacterium]|nr:hypothetical protein [Actinomycetes bacterium]
LGDIDSVWPGATETADGDYVVRQHDGSLQLWSTQPTRRTTVEGLSDRGIVVIDLTLDPASSPPATGPGVVLTQPVNPWKGSVEVTGIARPFEAIVEAQIEDDTGAPVSAIYSGSLRWGTRRASGYGVETNDWTEAWAPFAVRAEGLAPGDYTMVLEAEASGDPLSGLRIPFSVTEAGPVPELPSEEELGAIQALVDFA